MGDSTIVAVTGIVVSGLLGPAVAAYWSERRSERQRLAARADNDLHELRNLFAECLKMMLDARFGLVSIEHLVSSGALDPMDPKAPDEKGLEEGVKARKELHELQVLSKDMLQEYPRLLLMLETSHPAVEAFSKASSYLNEGLNAAVDLMQGTQDRRAAGEAVGGSRKSFGDSLAEFIKACRPIAMRKAE